MLGSRLIGISVLALLAGSLFSSGCISATAHQREIKRRMTAEYRTREYAARLNELETERARISAQVNNSQVRERELKTMLDEARKAINWGDFGLQAGSDGALSLAGDLTFSRGKHTLSSQGKKELDKVAKALVQSTASRVRIDGHTDSDPIKRSRYLDNMHLSLMRAHSVAKYLVGKGVAPGIISVAGYGSHQPRGKNKAGNRRVEIRAMVESAQPMQAAARQ